MKQFFLIIFCFFSYKEIYSKCMGNGIFVFPNEKNINQNSIFVLTGYAKSQEIILNLNQKNNIYLISGKKKIKLLVTEILVGGFNLTQAVLKPETELVLGQEYKLYINNIPEYESLTRYNKTKKEYEPISFKVTLEKDTKPPEVLSKPKELKKTVQYFGCGPEEYVEFNNPSKDDSEIIIKTTVKNLKTGKETIFYIEPEGEKIEVGHGMCSGAFDFDSSNNYQVEFSFMDSSGNITNWIGDRIQFTNPNFEEKINVKDKLK